MSNFTDNFNLTLPLGTENYDVDVFNNNFSEIDNVMGGIVRDCVTIAAVDTPQEFKKYADYVCTGTEDQRIIGNAINALEIGGKVVLLPGNYYNNGPISFTVSNIHLYAKGATINFNGLNQMSIFSFANEVENIIIEHLNINVTEDNKAGRIVLVANNPLNITFSNIKLSEKSGYCTDFIYFDSEKTIKGLKIINCIFETTESGIYLLSNCTTAITPTIYGNILLNGKIHLGNNYVLTKCISCNDIDFD